MTNIKQRYDAKKKKEAIQMLKEVAERIKNGEFEVESSGFWAGLPGNWTLKIQVKESDKSPKY